MSLPFTSHHSHSSDTPATASLPDVLSIQPAQMLVRIAHQSHLGDPEGCATILSLLITNRLLRSELGRVLAELGLNEAKFSALVTLYALDPEPSTPADLALQSLVSRTTMTDTLDALHAAGWIDRTRGAADRRTLHIQLTPSGRTLIENAVRPFLKAVGNCADTLTVEERRAVTGACAHLCAHFQPHSA